MEVAPYGRRASGNFQVNGRRNGAPTNSLHARRAAGLVCNRGSEFCGVPLVSLLRQVATAVDDYAALHALVLEMFTREGGGCRFTHTLKNCTARGTHVLRPIELAKRDDIWMVVRSGSSHLP